MNMVYKFNNICQVNFTFITDDGIIISKKTNVILTIQTELDLENSYIFEKNKTTISRLYKAMY